MPDLSTKDEEWFQYYLTRLNQRSGLTQLQYRHFRSLLDKMFNYYDDKELPMSQRLR